MGLNIFSIVTSDLSSSANIVYPVIQYTLMFLRGGVLLFLLVRVVFFVFLRVNCKLYLIVRAAQCVNKVVVPVFLNSFLLHFELMQSIIMAMKVFKYKFTKVTTILIYAGIFLCALCVGLNIFSIVF